MPENQRENQTAQASPDKHVYAVWFEPTQREELGRSLKSWAERSQEGHTFVIAHLLYQLLETTQKVSVQLSQLQANQEVHAAEAQAYRQQRLADQARVETNIKETLDLVEQAFLPRVFAPLDATVSEAPAAELWIPDHLPTDNDEHINFVPVLDEAGPVRNGGGTVDLRAVLDEAPEAAVMADPTAATTTEFDVDSLLADLDNATAFQAAAGGTAPSLAQPFTHIVRPNTAHIGQTWTPAGVEAAPAAPSVAAPSAEASGVTGATSEASAEAPASAQAPAGAEAQAGAQAPASVAGGADV